MQLPESKSIFFHLRRIILNFSYRAGIIFGINKKSVSILCYHGISNHPDRFVVSPESFEKEMEKISTYATFVSLDEVADYIIDGKKITKPAVAITLDDGYADAVNILPIAKRLNIPVALFVLSSPEKGDRQQLNNDTPFLTWDEISHLRGEGWTIGCHGATHVNFHQADKAMLRQEIIDAKINLEKKLGVEVKYFAYPGGRFNNDIVSLVREAGFRASFSIAGGNVDSSAERFLLPRSIIDKTHQLSEFPAVHSRTTYLLRKITDPIRLWNIFLRYK